MLKLFISFSIILSIVGKPLSNSLFLLPLICFRQSKKDNSNNSWKYFPLSFKLSKYSNSSLLFLGKTFVNFLLIEDKISFIYLFKNSLSYSTEE